MLKLKKIIRDLSVDDYRMLADSLSKTKASHTLLLLEHYRSSAAEDNDLMAHLQINTNAFYVLKSRLYDKIQTHLTGNIHITREEVIRLLQQIPEFTSANSREMSVALLEKLEKDLLYYHMHSELLQVYSALKKLHVYSQKYFHYSQLFNKHIAFSLSLEKSEEILGNFNRILGQYLFSLSPRQKDTLLFIRQEIINHHQLNPSRQIEIIRNLIEIELILFGNTRLEEEIHLEDKLLQTKKLVEELPESSPGKAYVCSLNYLNFEFYFKTGQSNNARKYFEIVEAQFQVLLLQTNISPNARFLISKICFLQMEQNTNLLQDTPKNPPLCDSDDTHSLVVLALYQAMCLFYQNKLKESATHLNQIINQHSFKDHFHIHIEIKLTLAYVYLRAQEYEMADNILKNISRKIKTENLSAYNHVLDLIKAFSFQIKQPGKRNHPKLVDQITLFMARNNHEHKILAHLMHEFKHHYQIH